MKNTSPQISSAHLGMAQALPVITDSTTSRVLVDAGPVRTVQFTFDTGQLLTEHSSPRAVMVLLSEGTMSFTVEETEHIMGAGDIIYLAPNAPHSLIAKSPCRLTLVMVDTEEETIA
ncbi:MAG: cupin domain-containing protein [Propionibacteriaceae bacterium]